MLTSTLTPSSTAHSIRVDHLAETEAPSAAELIGMLVAVTGGELASLETRGPGLIAALSFPAGSYRLQLDPLERSDRRGSVRQVC